MRRHAAAAASAAEADTSPSASCFRVFAASCLLGISVLSLELVLSGESSSSSVNQGANTAQPSLQQAAAQQHHERLLAWARSAIACVLTAVSLGWAWQQPGQQQPHSSQPYKVPERHEAPARGGTGAGKQSALPKAYFSAALAARLGSLPAPLQAAALIAAALAVSAAAFLMVPGAFWCPRWAVKIDVQADALLPPSARHADSKAPFATEPLVLVTAASAPFFDRLQNMVGSVQTWEPRRRLLLYDLGLLRSQLLEAACWRQVEARPFKFEHYPPHVRRTGNFAWKALILKEVLAGSAAQAVLWVDAGLELRSPLTTVERWLSQHGHVSALQEDAIGDAMYTRSMATVHEMALDRLWSEAQHWQFCAGGLQGFVRGSDAERLVLQPVVDCSLREACIAPPGASRLNHNFDQTVFTLALRAAKFACLPRETHCMWSPKKAQRAPQQLSPPIEIVSRGHRLPKPYAALLLRRPACSSSSNGGEAAEELVPWALRAPMGGGASLSRYSWAFRVKKIYLQAVGDAIVQAGSCVGVHLLAHALLWGLVGSAWRWGWLASARGGQHWLHGRTKLQAGMSAALAGLAMLALQATLLDVLGRLR